MEQIIKKINMIDILGMLLPGGLMLLLLEMDYHVLKRMGDYFEIRADKLLWIAIFLCASYFLGMLLHELGSMVEKLMWRNPLLSPRVYAAISTELLYNCGAEEQAKMPQEFAVWKTGAGIGPVIEKKWKKIYAFAQKNWVNCIGKGIRMFLRAVVSLSALVVVYFAMGGLRLRVYLIGIALTVLLCIVFHWKSFSRFVYAVSLEEYRDRMRRIIKDERIIQKESITSEENSRKYGLFCGYYSLMRSILVLMAILQIYVMIQGDNDRSHLASFYYTIMIYPSYAYLRCILVTALVFRYWHYACARFTYTYNGYIYNKVCPRHKDDTTKLNVEIVNSAP